MNESALDSSQRAFCGDPQGTIRLLAPAGSGKTHSLLWRCLALMQGASSARAQGRFLLVTFTRAARDELRDRLKRTTAFQPLRPLVDATTLNSWGFRWLRQRVMHPKVLAGSQERTSAVLNVLRPVWDGANGSPRIAAILTDQRRAFRAARQLIDLMDQLKGLGFRHDQHSALPAFTTHLSWLSRNGLRGQVNSLWRQFKELELVRADGEAGVAEAFEHYFRFWCQASEHLFASGFLTLEDQKYWALIRLENALRQGEASGVGRLRMIIVDEFQDINTLDLALLRAVSQAAECPLTVVGDDDQAIYEWRGATPQFILYPEVHIGGSYRTHILEVNYRSPRNIVELSQRLISRNKRRVPKRVVPASHEEADVVVHCEPSLKDTVAYVQRAVRRLVDGGRRVALISRKRSQIIPYQIVFAGDGVPFCAAEDLNVLMSEAFEQLKAILLLKAQADQPLPFGPDPIEGLLKMCDKVKRYPLSKGDRGQLRSHLARERPRTLVAALEALHGYRGPLKGTNTGGQMSATYYAAIRPLMTATSVSDTLRAISESFEGLQKDYGKALDDIFFADPPFLYLGEFAERYGDDFGRFYQDVEGAIASLTSLPMDDEEGLESEWSKQLHLMTALRAKGKEFDDVFVLDCNQGIWPSRLAVTEEEQEAERRLFYVAVTRARRMLTFLVNERIFEEVAVPTQYLVEMGLPTA